MELTKTSYLLLGMLHLGRRTGYEIKGLVDVSTRFFWAASYGQIYPELRRLEKLGLVTGERDDSNGRRRKAYELTAEGRTALRQWLTSDQPLHLELRDEGMLRLFFSDGLDAEERAMLWRKLGRTHGDIHDRLTEHRPGAVAAAEERGYRMPLDVLDFGVAFTGFVRDWCEQMEARTAEPPARSGGRS
ncbi:MAG TPA: PadR family transcriptional regulator [Thermoleophilaceae bacterium]|nr:PadR family transcriptional regulator [Thermoleophilaceae bacterium]